MTETNQDSAGKQPSIELRNMRTSDGGRVWELVKRAGTLDLNSPYHYLLQGKLYADTCLVAEAGDQLVGFTTALLPPKQSDAVFLWQVGVDPDWQGHGIAGRLVRKLVALPACRGRQYLETTVTPSNKASRALFHGFARRIGVEVEESVYFPEQAFPAPHEPEMLLRIGPLPAERSGFI